MAFTRRSFLMGFASCPLCAATAKAAEGSSSPTPERLTRDETTHSCNTSSRAGRKSVVASYPERQMSKSARTYLIGAILIVGMSS